MKEDTAHIIGLGRSGRAAAEFLSAKGWRVFISDDGDSASLRQAARELSSKGIEVFLGGHDRALQRDAGLVILSPGIRPNSPVLVSRQGQHTEIIGELELGWKSILGHVAAITGSNGKSTTTALLGEIFKSTGRKSFTCGNIGLPVCAIAGETDNESLTAIEVSSFQLLSISSFKPKVSVLLNITPDHIDYHGGYENYQQAKAAVWRFQNKNDWVVYNMDDPIVSKLITGCNAVKIPFSTSRVLTEGASISEGCFTVKVKDHELSIDLKELKQPGLHNQANALAAITSAFLLGLSKDEIVRGLQGFKGLPHRLELIRTVSEVEYINDSKATNVDSGRCALMAMRKPVVLIAGGRGKGDSYSSLKDIVKNKVKLMILIGETAAQVNEELGDVTTVMFASDMKDAVLKARDSSEAGDVVLLSPLAASFDMFDNFEHRGDVFRAVVEDLD